ncbi:hypothetical protein FWJ25_05015 [Marinobacter salinexigens]|uniref:Uncharacterized protein n=1 Tax=Marinobacter salinexigens TaxID=2919747 RepID=A0A5B0VJC3_9GAMM|nr:hypothetical protein [Marinobacter salinexigens]KAA1174752.1 hypothetical protein FWJ25_05015 [Marinobacter salinexigens]
MKLIDVFQGRLERVSEEVLPQLQEAWVDLRKRLDGLNCSLANKAVPETRRSRVSELSLQEKAEKAGQGKAAMTAIKSPGKRSSAK